MLAAVTTEHSQAAARDLGNGSHHHAADRAQLARGGRQLLEHVGHPLTRVAEHAR